VVNNCIDARATLFIYKGETMRKAAIGGVAILLLLILSVPAFSQGFFATVSGTVTDPTGALLPGVSVRATALDTGVVSTKVTNEAGVYNFGDLLPGKYTLSASLPGFQTKNLTDIQLSQNTSSRYNFQLVVAGVNTQVEVSVSAGMVLATQGATVGQVLNQKQVQELPFVGNNILDLITVMAGVENVVPTNPPSAANAFGREATTFAGVRADNIAIVRDGIQMQDTRNPNGIYSITTINPDLVGEIRLILAPVDVELGRGNGSIQYSTRSGTNKFSGAAVWSFRNTALDPNSWTNNRSQTIPPGSSPEFVALAEQGKANLAVQPTWNNTHQFTASFGGPIIQNKTFFFALFDLNRVRGRALNNFTVPTPCARLGIYRYFNGWNSGNVNTAETTGSAATRPSVNLDGSPNSPSALPVGSTLVLPGPYDNSVQAISVFGPLASKPTKNDCSDAPINTTTLVPNGVTVGASPGAGGGWDRYRQQLDASGYIRRAMAFFPAPNNYETGDGLNTAGYRYLRPFRGVDNLFGSGEATGDRIQYNVKIDHNFTSNHKANVNLSYERVDSDDVLANLPGAFSNLNYRRPIVLSSGFTSTLSPTLLNEARFGIRINNLNVVAPWHRPVYDEELKALLPADVNGFRVIPTFIPLGLCNPHSGARPPGSGCIGLTGTSYEHSPTYTFSNTVSWTHGAHSFRFNGELRLNSSQTRTPTTGGFGSASSTFATVTGVTTGNNGVNGITGTTPGTTSATDIAGSNPSMAGLLAASATNARALMSYLAGSLNNVQSQYYLSDPNHTDVWSDFRTSEFIKIRAVQTEASGWAKDEWKVTKNLTLTPGIRWDYYASPYLDSGLSVSPVGGGAAAFGISGRDFTGWMRPGVRGELTATEFVGPHSPHPDKSARPALNNFGPSLAFAWQVPWFGEGKTTVRGGYQINFLSTGQFSGIAGALSVAPGATLTTAFTTQNVYLDLTKLDTVIPVAPTTQPLQPLSPMGPRTATFSTWDPNYKSPYTQNLSLSVTHSLNRTVTLDVRYVGTLSRKTRTTQDLNISNFLYNGLFEALDAVRTGKEITKNVGDPLSLLDQIFKGVNLCTTTALPNSGSCTTGQPYGAVGTTAGGVYQSAAYQMRSSSTFNADLANANYNALAGTIKNFNYSTSGSNAALPAIPTGIVAGALRLNNFPENFVDTNPQFGTMNLFTNSGYNNFHSLQAQLTTRPIQGFSGSVTYDWSRNLGINQANGNLAVANPVERHLDYTDIGSNPRHSLRTNGTIELPIGPNKLLFSNSSGFLARVLERWQLGLIYNLSSGVPTSITATTMLYGNGLPDVRHPVDFNKIKGVRWGIPAGNFLEGRYFDNGDVFVKVDDPTCFNVTNLQNLSGLAPATGSPSLRCSLDALAMVVPAGTEDSQVLSDGRTVQVVLQHAQPGKKGNLGNSTIMGLGSWRFDANLSKTFRLTESKSLALRIDTQNVLNHPQPAFANNGASFSITGNTPFGQLPSKTGGRILQGQLRLSF
jgi:carboxypeptidase family protein